MVTIVCTVAIVQSSRHKSPRAILLADAMAPCGRERAGAHSRAHGSHGKSWDDGCCAAKAAQKVLRGALASLRPVLE